MTLVLKNICRKIGKHSILSDINLTVNHGECLALLGPSGCGKSSILRVIAGLDKADKGSVSLDGVDISDLSPMERNIGMVFQSYALFPHLTVAQNLSLGLRIRKVSPSDQKYKVSNVLEMVQLTEFSNHRPSQLSGGQKQRVALARALLRDPSLFLLDEPMSNLDAKLREELRPELRRLFFNCNQPVVYVTHDQNEAMALANRIAILREGRLEQIGTPQDLYHNPASVFVASFIGRPRINFLTTLEGLIIGIRPEDIFLDSRGIQARVLNKEWLGSNQIVELDTPKGNLKMICSGSEELGESINVNWDKNKELYFDENTKKRALMSPA